MVGIGGLVGGGIVVPVLPAVHEDVPDVGPVSVVLHPAPFSLVQRDHARAGTLAQDNVGQPRLHPGGGDCGGTPLVGVLHLVAYREGLLGVI